MQLFRSRNDGRISLDYPGSVTGQHCLPHHHLKLSKCQTIFSVKLHSGVRVGWVRQVIYTDLHCYLGSRSFSLVVDAIYTDLRCWPECLHGVHPSPVLDTLSPCCTFWPTETNCKPMYLRSDDRKHCLHWVIDNGTMCVNIKLTYWLDMTGQGEQNCFFMTKTSGQVLQSTGVYLHLEMLDLWDVHKLQAFMCSTR